MMNFERIEKELNVSLPSQYYDFINKFEDNYGSEHDAWTKSLFLMGEDWIINKNRLLRSKGYGESYWPDHFFCFGSFLCSGMEGIKKDQGVFFVDLTTSTIHCHDDSEPDTNEDWEQEVFNPADLSSLEAYASYSKVYDDYLVDLTIEEMAKLPEYAGYELRYRANGEAFLVTKGAPDFVGMNTDKHKRTFSKEDRNGLLIKLGFLVPTLAYLVIQFINKSWGNIILVGIPVLILIPMVVTDFVKLGKGINEQKKSKVADESAS